MSVGNEKSLFTNKNLYSNVISTFFSTIFKIQMDWDEKIAFLYMLLNPEEGSKTFEMFVEKKVEEIYSCILIRK